MEDSVNVKSEKKKKITYGLKWEICELGMIFFRSLWFGVDDSVLVVIDINL